MTIEAGNPSETKAQELETIKGVLDFLAEGEVSVQDEEDRFAARTGNPQETILYLSRSRPNTRAYSLGTGLPWGYETNYFNVKISDFAKAVGFAAPRLLLTQERPYLLGVYIRDPQKLIDNIRSLAAHSLQGGQTVLEASQLPSDY